MNKLAILLKTAEKVGARNSKGGQDTELAHISPKESALLKLLGGSGRTDPDTGLRHFDTGDGGDGISGSFDNASSNAGWGDAVAGMAAGGGVNANGSFGGEADDGGNGPSDWTGGNWQDPGSWTVNYDDAMNAARDAYQNSRSQNDRGTDDENSFDDGSMAASMAAASARGNGTENLNDDGSGKGRSDTAFGPGGELEGFGQWSQEVGNSIGSYGWDADKSNAWMTGLLGYDPSKTSLGDVVNGARSALGLSGKDTGPQAATWDENDLTNDMGLSGRQSSRSVTTDAARNEYNTMGWLGQLTAKDDLDNVREATPWSYTDLEGKDNTNWGSIGNDLTSVVSSPVTAAVATGLGLGLPYAAINGALQAARGNYTPGASTLANVLGGPQAGLGVNMLSSLLNGTPGNIAAPLASGYLNTVAPNLGTALNLSGLTNLGARGMNTAYQTALADIENSPVDGDLSSEGVGASGEPSFMSADLGEVAPTGGGGEAPAEAFAAGASPSWGGGGSSDFSDYSANDFMGSKKKSRYRRPNSLMALLGEQDAV